MKSLPTLIDSQGRAIALDRQLGSGGEGAVFALRNDSAQVAKLYHQKPSSETVAKLTAMIALTNPKILQIAAWPNGLLLDARSRQPVGFLMPKLVDFQEIWHVYHPVERLKFFPRAGWKFQVRTAYNLAAAFDEVHRAGVVVGDVQLRNAQVSPQALVRLVDCDSFQIRAQGRLFGCHVGLPHYTSPELQDQSLRDVQRTENHDRFGLAVLIYQLLFVGRHPYAGIYRGAGDPSFEHLIKEYRFAQGPRAKSWQMEPPPHTPTFADIPPNVGDLFCRAFERGSAADNRPTAAEWLPVLQQLERHVVTCAVDAGHEFWQGAKSCVWCRLAAKGGPEYYFGVAGGSDTFAVDEATLQQIMKRLQAAATVDFPYERSRFTPSLSLVPRPVPADVHDNRMIENVITATIAGCALVMPLGLWHGFICVAAFLTAAFFAIWLAIHRRLSPWHREQRRRTILRNTSLRQLESLETDWLQCLQRYRDQHHQQCEEIHRAVGTCRGFAQSYRNELKQLTANAESMARIRHLRLHLLADADIPKIGAGRKQSLASNAILTAEDIDLHRILAVKGFGEMLASSLLAWKHGVLQSFRFDPATSIPPAEQRKFASTYQSRQKQLLAELNRRMVEVESCRPKCQSEIQKLVPSIRKAIVRYHQSEVDLRPYSRRYNS